MNSPNLPNYFEANYIYDNAAATGNLTQTQQWDSGQGTWITQYQSYNTNGNVSTQTDANNNVTAICYDGNDNQKGLYPVTVVVAASGTSCPNPTERAEGRRSTYSSDFSSGVQLSATDADNNIPTSYTYDNLARQVSATETGGGLQRTTSTSYDDVNLTITTTQSDTQSSSLTNTTYYDELGRVRLTLDGAGNRVASAYRYGSSQRYELQSTPYTASGGPTGWTLTTMDTTGRVTEVDHYSGGTPPAPWGNNGSLTGTAKYAYDQTPGGCTGPAVSATDEAANTTYRCADGLDRLISVTEPNAATGGTGTVTTYGYDSLGNLSSVDATGEPAMSCGHMRCFTYSTLSRLLSASNPESNTTTYSYDSNGNLLKRVDANGSVMTVAGYDGLNRPTGSPAVSYAPGSIMVGSPAVTYNVAATPSVTYAYDSDFKGALSSVSSSVSTSSYTHDGLGRIKGSTQTTGANGPYTFTYGYTLTDTLNSIKYPSGRQVSYALDAADRVTTVQNVTGGGNYVSNVSYTPADGLSSVTLGNGLTHAYSWNDRVQPTGVTATGAGNTLLQLGFYPCQYNAVSCGTGNNGNLQSQTISMPGLSLTQTYSYDHLNRLTQAQESGGAGWSQSYGYDVLGNRWVSGNSGLPNLTQQTPTSSSWYSTSVPDQYAASTGWIYDLTGNVLQVGGMARSFIYDAENRQVTACFNCAQGSPTGSYQYDGNGQQVIKTVAGGPTTIYVYDAFSNLAAEYSTGAAQSACGTATCYVTADHLGSTRMLTPNSVSASVVRYDYQPFGQEISAGYGSRTTGMGYLSSPDATNPKFTGQSRDQETGLDNFLARYYDPLQGRFTSPDPGNAGADPANPQSWNGYGYVANNPMTYTDPSGEFMLVTEAGAAACGPVCAGIGAAVDLGALLYGILGGGHSTIPPSLATPSSPVLSESLGMPPGLNIPGFPNGASGYGGCPTGPYVNCLDPTTTAQAAARIGLQTIGRAAITFGTVFVGILTTAQNTQQDEAIFIRTGALPGIATVGGVPLPPVEYIEGSCRAVGPPVVVPSTRKGNKGGKSIEQEYICPDGQTYTVRTLTNPSGRPIDKHARPGKPKYGPVVP